VAAELREVLETLRVVSVPTRTRFRGVAHREAALFEGPQGVTEFSPFLEYGDDEAATWLAAAIDFGFREQPEPLRSSIAVNATVPAVSPDAVSGVLERFGQCGTVKVKVAELGQTLSEDIARVREVRECVGQDVRIRVDANGAWSVDEALEAIERLAEFELEYVEQPCATVSELLSLRAQIDGMGVFIAADESVRKASDPLEVARAGAADILVLKAPPLGGIRRALDIIAQAELPAVISSALDTSVGISMGLHLAASVPRLEMACGLATVALLEGDVVEHPLVPVNGELPVHRVTLSEARVSEFAANAERTQWWTSRITRCFDQASELLDR
jgi:O-succinylbenzoate synthase